MFAIERFLVAADWAFFTFCFAARTCFCVAMMTPIGHWPTLLQPRRVAYPTSVVRKRGRVRRARQHDRQRDRQDNRQDNRFERRMYERHSIGEEAHRWMHTERSGHRNGR